MEVSDPAVEHVGDASALEVGPEHPGRLLRHGEHGPARLGLLDEGPEEVRQVGTGSIKKRRFVPIGVKGSFDKFLGNRRIFEVGWLDTSHLRLGKVPLRFTRIGRGIVIDTIVDSTFLATKNDMAASHHFFSPSIARRISSSSTWV